MRRTLTSLIAILLISLACSSQGNAPPTPIPSGVLIHEIPTNMDIIFDSIRYVLNDIACLNKNYEVDKGFINLPGCNAKIYDPEDNGLASPRQLFAMDVETGEVAQITNTDCSYVLGQVVDPTTLMTLAICSDTDNNGKINEKDTSELYFLDLALGEMECLTCNLGVTSINNADYSQANKKIVFSAQHSTLFHNYLFSIDADKNLTQITDQSEYMDFDCSWSEDGSKIVFSRLPAPWFSTPSQVWLMETDGTNQERITEGGPNPNNEENHGPYPIGIDADPDLSPDNKKIVFSRLRSGKENIPFGVYELIVVDVDTKEVQILDSQYANMIPQWKSNGILINRQIGVSNASDIKAMNMKQNLVVYREEFPFNIFPIGAYGGYWIEQE